MRYRIYFTTFGQKITRTIMKKFTKFFLGLSCGLLIGFLFFNTSSAISEITGPDQNATPSVNRTQGEIPPGEVIDLETANSLVEAYRTNVMDACDAASTSGGFIDKASLNTLLGEGGDAPIKFRFYYEANEGEGTGGNVGVLFYSSKEATTALRNGSGSYCPSLCDYE